MIIVLAPHTFIRFQSVRTGQTMLHANRLPGALIIYGDAKPDRYDVRLDGEEVRIDGTLWDRFGPAISFGDDSMAATPRCGSTSASCPRITLGLGSETDRDPGAHHRTILDAEIELLEPAEDDVAHVRALIERVVEKG